MLDTLTYLKQNLSDHFVIYFIPLYILGGRPAAVLSAQFLGYRISFLLPVVVLLDTIQVPFLYHLYGAVSDSAFFKRLKGRAEKKEQKLLDSKIFGWMRLLGMPGVVAVTMTPLKGCGMWSGVLLSHLLKLPKTASYPLLVLGSALGCIFIYGIGETMKQLW
ncbi:MAG: small multi-drug export protein, partial [Deltaproteobacteria bacterium]|nr:small multi-drug export protein [Deltaproteobacteria bacterium]